MHRITIKGAALGVAMMMLLCSPSVNIRAAQEQEITVTDTYTTKDPDERKEFSAEKESGGEQYVLKGVSYETIQETPVLEKQTVTEQVSEVVYDRSSDFDDQISKQIDGQVQTFLLQNVEYKPIKTKLGNGKASIQEKEEFLDEGNIPDQKVVDYTDPETGITVQVSLDKSGVEEIEHYEQLQYAMTFYVIDAPYFVLGGAHIPNAGDVPSVAGYEELYLDYLGLGSGYRITDAAWSGEAYMQDGELCRDAICYVDHYIPSYQATYGGTEVELPEVDGYEVVAIYAADVEMKTGETEYTIKATATYTVANSGLTAMQITMISLGVIVVIVVILLILFDLSKKKKKTGGK